MRKFHIISAISALAKTLLFLVAEPANASVLQKRYDSIQQSDYISEAVMVKGKRYPYLLLPPKNIAKGEGYLQCYFCMEQESAAMIMKNKSDTLFPTRGARESLAGRNQRSGEINSTPSRA